MSTNNSALQYYPNVYSDLQCQSLLDELNLVEKPEIVVYGKVVRQQRDVGFFSNVVAGYTYSHKFMPSQKLPEWLLDILNDVNQVLGTDFNSVLINYYEDGSQYIGSHADDEPTLDLTPGVASISFGASRKFRIRNKQKEIVVDLPLNDGDLVHMAGKFQEEFKHEIPKELKISQWRYSLTFRKHSVR